MGQINTNLLKRHLQHDSVLFVPLTSLFDTFLLRHAQKSRRRKWPTSVNFLIALFFFTSFLFLLFFNFCCSDCYQFKKFLRQEIFTMEKLTMSQVITLRRFCCEFFTQLFECNFADSSRSIEPITLMWVSLERSFPFF